MSLAWSTHPEWGLDGQSVIWNGPGYVVRWNQTKGLSIVGWNPTGWFTPDESPVEIKAETFLVSAYRPVGNVPEGNILRVGNDPKAFTNPLRGGYWHFERSVDGEILARPTSAGGPGIVGPAPTLRWTGETWVEYVLPQPPGPPTVTFTVDKASIIREEAAILSWRVTGANDVRGSWISGSVNPESSWVVYPTVTTTYTLMATAPGGSTSAMVTVTVVVLPGDTPGNPPTEPTSGTATTTPARRGRR